MTREVMSGDEKRREESSEAQLFKKTQLKKRRVVGKPTRDTHDLKKVLIVFYSILDKSIDQMAYAHAWLIVHSLYNMYKMCEQLIISTIAP